MSHTIKVAFGEFVSELCPFHFFNANFVYINLVHVITYQPIVQD